MEHKNIYTQQIIRHKDLYRQKVIKNKHSTGKHAHKLGTLLYGVLISYVIKYFEPHINIKQPTPFICTWNAIDYIDYTIALSIANRKKIKVNRHRSLNFSNSIITLRKTLNYKQLAFYGVVNQKRKLSSKITAINQ